MQHPAVTHTAPRPSAPASAPAGLTVLPDDPASGPRHALHARGCPAARLVLIDRVHDVLCALAAPAPMPRLMPPYVVRRADGGLSGFVLAAGGHVGLHTLPARGEVTVDVCTGRAFDVERALATLRAAFAPRAVDGARVERRSDRPSRTPVTRNVVLRARRAVTRAMELEASR